MQEAGAEVLKQVQSRCAVVQRFRCDNMEVQRCRYGLQDADTEVLGSLTE